MQASPQVRGREPVRTSRISSRVTSSSSEDPGSLTLLTACGPLLNMLRKASSASSSSSLCQQHGQWRRGEHCVSSTVGTLPHVQRTYSPSELSSAASPVYQAKARGMILSRNVRPISKSASIWLRSCAAHSQALCTRQIVPSGLNAPLRGRRVHSLQCH